ncbi:MAG: hypothetical protein MZU79_05090 [Anaerotruncus sp.]|nr:hypothetical protein [Anaerotruncus sp.]
MAALFEEQKNPQEFLKSLKIQPHPRRGLRVHAQGQGRRPAARGHGPRLRLQDPHGGRAPRLRGPRQRHGRRAQDRAQDGGHRRDPDRRRKIADAGHAGGGDDRRGPAGPPALAQRAEPDDERSARPEALGEGNGEVRPAGRTAPRGSAGRTARGPARSACADARRVLPAGGARPDSRRSRVRRDRLRTGRAAPRRPPRQGGGPDRAGAGRRGPDQGHRRTDDQAGANAARRSRASRSSATSPPAAA